MPCIRDHPQIRVTAKNERGESPCPHGNYLPGEQGVGNKFLKIVK